MKVHQRDPRGFGPTPTLIPSVVIDSAGTTSNVTNRGVTFEKFSGASHHFEYTITGLGVDGSAITQGTAPVDDSDFPLVRRSPDWATNGGSFPYVYLQNSRGKRGPIGLDFTQRSASDVFSNPKSLTAGTYAKYSWDRVAAIFSALDDGTPENHKVFGPGQVRRHPSIIPHASLTCHVAGAGGGLNNVGGHLRMVAVTRRHCIQIGHSGNGTHQNFQVRFRDVNGNAVDRTVVADYNVLYGEIPFPPDLVSIPGGGIDIRLHVLNEDLPESIAPAPYVGDWFFGYTGSATAGTANVAAFGFASFNQDTHISPCQSLSASPLVFDSDYTLIINGVSVSGREFGGLAPIQPISLEGFHRWSWAKEGAVVGEWYSDHPFHHYIRAGDSGSPIFWPVANNKWAIGAGIISGSMWRPAAINALIAHANDDLGIVGTYEVEVAADPLA